MFTIQTKQIEAFSGRAKDLHALKKYSTEAPTFLLKANKNNDEVTFYVHSIFGEIKYSIFTSVASDIECNIEIFKFHRIISSMPSGSITMRLKNDKIILSILNKQIEINVLEKNENSPSHQEEEQGVCTTDAESLFKLVSNCLFLAKNNFHMPCLDSVRVKFNGHLEFASSDGVRCSRYRTPIKYKAKIENEKVYVVPYTNIAFLEKVLSDFSKGEVLMALYDKSIKFTIICDEHQCKQIFSLKIHDSVYEYPNIDNIYKASKYVHVCKDINKNDFMSALKLAYSFTTEMDKSISLDISNIGFIVSVKTLRGECFEETILCTVPKELHGFSLRFDPDKLLGLLRKQQGNISIYFQEGPLRPFLLVSEMKNLNVKGAMVMSPMSK